MAETLLELADLNPWGNGFILYGYGRDLPIGKRSVSEAFNATVRVAGIPEEEQKRCRLTFHAWRHFYNTMTRGNDRDPCYRIAILPDRAVTIIR